MRAEIASLLLSAHGVPPRLQYLQCALRHSQKWPDMRVSRWHAFLAGMPSCHYTARSSGPARPSPSSRNHDFLLQFYSPLTTTTLPALTSFLKLVLKFLSLPPLHHILSDCHPPGRLTPPPRLGPLQLLQSHASLRRCALRSLTGVLRPASAHVIRLKSTASSALYPQTPFLLPTTSLHMSSFLSNMAGPPALPRTSTNAPGSDGWEKWSLGHACEPFLDIVVKLLNYVVAHSYFPNALKAAYLTPVYKKGDLGLAPASRSTSGRWDCYRQHKWLVRRESSRETSCSFFRPLMPALRRLKIPSISSSGIMCKVSTAWILSVRGRLIVLWLRRGCHPVREGPHW